MDKIGIMLLIFLVFGCSNRKIVKHKENKISNKFFKFSVSENLKVIEMDENYIIKFNEDLKNVILLNKLPGKFTKEEFKEILEFECKGFNETGVVTAKSEVQKNEKTILLETNKGYCPTMIVKCIFKYKNGEIFSFSFLSMNKDIDKLNIFNKIVESIKVKTKKSDIDENQKYKSYYTKDEVIEDFIELNEKLKAHPKIDYNTSMEIIERKRKRSIEKINKKKRWKKEEVFKIFGEYIALIKDSHTKINLKTKYLKDVFPVRVNIRDGKIYVKKENEKLPNLPEDFIGSEIISINGNSAIDILKKSKKVVSFSPYCEKWAEYQMGELFTELLYYLFRGKDYFKITYKSKEGIINEIAIDMSTKNYNYKKEDIDFYIEENKDYLLVRFNTFSNEKFEIIKKQTDDLFSYVKENELKNIIVDLRENSGGELLIAEYFHKYFNSSLKNQKNYYDGNIYLLVGRGTFSSGAFITETLKNKEDKVIVIGENLAFLEGDFGSPVFTRLKNTDLTFTISTLLLESKKNSEKKLITPEILVNIDGREEALGIDKTLNKAIELIKNNGLNKSSI